MIRSKLGRWAFVLLLLAPSIAAAEEPLRVGVLPLEGDQGQALSRTLVSSLRGFKRLSVVSLLDPGAVLGAQAQIRLSQCSDDRCRADVVSALRLDRLVIGQVDQAGDRARLSLRLVDTASASARVVLRSSRELPQGDAGALRRAVMLGAPELFPEEAAQSFGTLVIATDVDGAEVELDGESIGRSPVPPIETKAGLHTVSVRHSGRRSFEARTEVFVGQSTLLEVELPVIRSDLPLILGLSALGVAATGLVVGFTTEATVSGWEDACPADASCQSGYTLARYQDDESSLSLRRGVTNGLLIGAGVLAVASVVTYFFDPLAEAGP